MIEQSRIDNVLRRVSQLRQLHSYRDREKDIIRAVCSSPEEGLKAILGDIGDTNPYSVPAANLVLSGITRLGQKLGRAPDLRVDPPMGNDAESARKKAEKRARIVTAYDEADQLERILNQTGLWLPGYTFAAWVVKEAFDDDGNPYPGIVNLDPYGTYPGSSNGKQPRDLAHVYKMSARDLAEKYPEHRMALLGKRDSGGGIILDPGDYPSTSGNSWLGAGSSWGNPSGTGVEVAEYYDGNGCWVVVPEKRLLLEFYENPLSSTQFYVLEKYSFDRPVGQYDHAIGMQTAMAQMSSLGLMALQDGVFSETNVRGELLSGQYRKGRFAVNYFTPGTQIDKPATNVPYQLFQQLDRLERQFRTTAGYSPVDDAISPAAQATGQGIDRLTAGLDLEVKQYLGIMRRGLEAIDRKRLEWDEKCYGNRTKPLVGVRKGQSFAETYTPSKDIKGNYRTRRTYGAMAGLDDQNKISALLLLKQGELIDTQSAMEELDLGGRSVTQVQERIEDEKVRRLLMEAMASGQPLDPRVAMTLVELLPDSEMKQTLRTFWTPDEPAMSPEQEAMLAPQPAAPQGPPPPIEEVMAMMAQGGGMPPAEAGMPPMPAGMVA